MDAGSQTPEYARSCSKEITEYLLPIVSERRANPRAYPAADIYDLGREPESPLLSFGPGLRTCPGMHLARKELAVALDVLCELFPDMHLLDAAEAQPTGTVLRGPQTLRVALR